MTEKLNQIGRDLSFLFCIIVLILTGCDNRTDVTSNLAAAEASIESTYTYTVTFRPNGGTGRVFEQSFRGGQPQALLRCVFQRVGYTFGGWATSAKGAAIYRNSDIVTLTKDVTLYAVWKANTYTVVFDANGGSGSMDKFKMTYDVSADLPANAFSKTEYDFVGWNTKADGTGTSYADGANIKNLTAENKVEVTLYAKWGKVTNSALLSTLLASLDPGGPYYILINETNPDMSAIKAALTTHYDRNVILDLSLCSSVT
ncbi:MAG: InlB B-repeat-containing protein, partial [Spirochaetales bacterium]|nr:InlB B-repeat-containing protein [Spirochaetales bacterium]